MKRDPPMVRIEIRVPPDIAARWNALPNTALARRVIALGLDAVLPLMSDYAERCCISCGRLYFGPLPCPTCAEPGQPMNEAKP